MPRHPSSAALARSRVLAPVRVPLLGASIVMAAASLLALAPAVLVVEAARRMLAPPVDWAAVTDVLVWAVVALGLRGLLQFLALLWSHLIDTRHKHALRTALVDKLSRLPLGWFSRRSSGEVKKMLQDDIGALHYLVAHAQLEIVAAVTVPVATLAYLFVVDWRLATVLLLPLLAYGAALRVMMGPGHATQLADFERWQARVESSVVEFVDGIAVVRTFGSPGRAHRRYQEAIDGYATFFRAWSRPMLRIESVATPLLSAPFMLLLVVLTGLLLAPSGTPAPVDVLAFLLLGLGLGGAVLTIGYGAQALRQATTAAERLDAVDRTPDLPARHHPTTLPSGPLRVELDDVTYSYDGDRDVLDAVTLTLEPGTVTALVGPSGSGKSTLARLLPRFADPCRGEVRLGGVDLRHIDPAELYRHVGFVLQEIVLVRGTVRENIAVGRPDASHADVERAARAAQIHDRILELPHGYDTEIGHDAHLSGGEAQRVAIARALLSDTPVVVLDEATAFADPESEAAIQDALSELVAGRTVLVIAHRLHTVTGVDRIVVLDHGRVVEQGSHPDLLAAGGLYARLWAANERARDRVDIERTETTR